jgi:hypothetical protein
MDSNGIGDLGKYDFMNKGMYPGSQIDRSYYATPTQVPLGAQAAMADYDPAVNPLTGQPVSRFARGGIASFAEGGSPFADDPNNFAADLTKAYKATLGRDPSTEELRANVDALNKDPDAYAFIVDQLVDDPSAAKFYAKNAKPQVDEEGNEIAPAAYDPNQIATELKGAYGKYTPKPEVGGIQGFANKIGPYAPFLAAAAAIAGPAIAAKLASEGALVAAPIAAPSLGITAIAPEVAGAIGAAGTTAATTGGAYGAMGGIGGGAMGTGMTLPSVAAIQSSAGLGLGGAGGATGMSTLGKMMATKMALETIAGGGGQGGQPSAGPTSTTSYIPFNPNQGQNTPSIPSYNPAAANPFAISGMTSKGNYGYDPMVYSYGMNPRRSMAAGGIAELAAGGNTNLGSYSDGGHLLKGPGDGMSDHIPATIGGQQPARLAEGEFVVPADVVSHLGNGSTDAGAKQLYKMMDKIRKARTGNAKQGKQINPDKFFPKG